MQPFLRPEGIKMKKIIKTTGVAVPAIYFMVLLFLTKYLYDLYTESISSPSFNPATLITPLVSYIGLGFAYVTIKINRNSTKEKNALDFEKVMSDPKIETAIAKLYKIRSSHLHDNGKLNRKTMSEYMKTLACLNENDRKKILPDEEIKKLKEKNNKVLTRQERRTIKDHDEISEKKDVRNAVTTVLNAMESCANAIRYDIYDEVLIYNIYGAQLAEIYEMSYQYIRERQYKLKSLYVNAEWLAVKWTLEKTINETRSGTSSNREEVTTDIISHAHAKLKEHRTAPNKKPLRKMLKKLKKFTYPS